MVKKNLLQKMQITRFEACENIGGVIPLSVELICVWHKIGPIWVFKTDLVNLIFVPPT